MSYLFFPSQSSPAEEIFANNNKDAINAALSAEVLLTVNEQENPSRVHQWAVIAFFGIFATAALLSFTFNSYQLLRDMAFGASIITFNKGAMYMLGVGIGAGYLTYAFVGEATGKPPSGGATKYGTRWVVGVILVIFALPQVIHFGVNRYTTAYSYRFCPEASKQWLHVRTMVYSVDGCTALQNNKALP